MKLFATPAKVSAALLLGWVWFWMFAGIGASPACSSNTSAVAPSEPAISSPTSAPAGIVGDGDSQTGQVNTDVELNGVKNQIGNIVVQLQGRASVWLAVAVGVAASLVYPLVIRPLRRKVVDDPDTHPAKLHTRVAAIEALLENTPLGPRLAELQEDASG